MSDSKYLSLADAQKDGGLQEFVAQEEAKGIGPVDANDLDAALRHVIKLS